MIASMTAFARHEQQESFGTLIWELRSVNQRYLEPNFRIPDFARSSEHTLRETLRKQLNRGKLECSLRFEKNSQSSGQIQLNQDWLNALLTANKSIAEQIPNARPEKASTFLQWPGVIEAMEVEKDVLEAALINSFQQAVIQLITHRKTEGEQLKKLIEQRLETIENICQQVRGYLPAIIAKQKQKLIDKFEELQLNVDADRIEQEIVLLAQKIDVDEELDRLETHIREVKNTLKKGGPCGRRLDFLMQELNREANTLGSKSINSETTQAAVDLKVAIEQMREQIQNIE